MSKQSQNIGDNSTAHQAARDIVYNGVNYSEVRDICHNIMKGEIAIARLEAMDEMNRRLEHFSEKLIPALVQKEVSADEFKKPEVQLFIHDTQRTFLESGKSEPSAVTIDMVTKTLAEKAGSPRQLIFKQAATISAKINEPTANFISLLFILTRTKKNLKIPIDGNRQAIDLKHFIRPLIDNMLQNLKKIYPFPTITPIEKDYLRMIGVLSESELTRSTPKDYLMQSAESFHQPLTKNEVEELLTLGAKDSDFRWLAPEAKLAWIADPTLLDFTNTNFIVLSDGAYQTKNNWRNTQRYKDLISRTSGQLIKDTMLEIAESEPLWNETLEWHRKGKMGGAILTPVGVAIGLSNAIRIGISLDDRIWFPTN